MLKREMKNGRLEIQIVEDRDDAYFEALARRISRRFGGRMLERLDGPDQRYWDIEISGQVVTLHLEHYLGISLFASKPEANEMVKRVGDWLDSRKAGGFMDRILTRVGV